MKKYLIVPLALLLALIVYGLLATEEERITMRQTAPVKVEHEKVTRATMLLREYDECASREEACAYRANAADGREKRRLLTESAERAHLVMFAVFQEFACAYDALHEEEKRAFFKIAGNDAPHGFGAIPSSDDPRRDLETFLENAFREIDYMSAFSVPAETHEAIKAEYRTTLRARGLIACK